MTVSHPSRLELAFGADPAGDPDDWTWTEIPQDRWPDQTVQIRRGRADEASEIGPSQASFVVDNRSGDYTPGDPRSPHWPDLRRGTPVRFSARRGVDGGFSSGFSHGFSHGEWRTRFVGQVSEWIPEWPEGDLSDHDNPEAYPGEAQVTLVCNGILRRLGQGAKPLRSALSRATPNHPTTIAYWPLEAPSAPSSPSPIPGVQAARLGGTIEYGGDDTLPGSAVLPKVTAGADGRAIGTVPGYTPGDNSKWTGHILVRAPAISGFVRVLTVRSATGQLTARLSATQLEVVGWFFDGTVDDPYPISETVDLTDPIAGEWVRVSLSAQNTITTTTIGWSAVVALAGHPDPIAETSDVIDASGPIRVGLARTIIGGGTTSAPSEGLAFGHMAVTTGEHDWDWLPDLGWIGETSADRFERLCTEEAIDHQTIGDGSTPMGPQTVTTLLALLQECAAAETGLLGEMVDRPGLTFRTRPARYNQPPALVLDASANEIDAPFVPTFDDQRLRNSITVSRQGGTGCVAEDEASIDAEGIYDEQVTVNVADDHQACDLAWWRLHLGIREGMRYPSLSGDVHEAGYWLDLAIGDRVQVTDLPPQHPGDVDVIVEGSTETITNETWAVETSCSPANVWDVAELPETTQLGEVGNRVLSDGFDRSDRTLDDRADTGQQYHNASIFPLGSIEAGSTFLRIVDGRVELPGPGAGYDWLYQDTDEVSLTFQFGPGDIQPDQIEAPPGEDHPNPISAVALIISKRLSFDDPRPIALNSIHCVVGPFAGGVFLLDEILNPFVPDETEADDLEVFTAPGPVLDPLDPDTDYTFTLRIDRATDTLTIEYPNGTVNTITDPLVTELWGPTVLFEIVRYPDTFDTDPEPTIHGIDGWGGEGLLRLASGDSTLATGVDTDDTTLSVTVGGILWTADDLPFALDVEGEEMVVTAISGASSPQTFTVTRGPVPRAHSAGTVVEVSGRVLAL